MNKQLERTLLFVCTGNTCRSPMAEAIARDLIEASPTPIKTIVASAGVGAMTGAPATREAVEALKQMGIASPRLRGSRTLTRQMIAEADAIFTMTRPHLQAVLDMDPTAAAKAQVLDPEGEDVADPIGAPAVVYSETARRIREMIAVRLQELDE